jgi:hypothetical protein
MPEQESAIERVVRGFGKALGGEYPGSEELRLVAHAEHSALLARLERAEAREGEARLLLMDALDCDDYGCPRVAITWEDWDEAVTDWLSRSPEPAAAPGTGEAERDVLTERAKQRTKWGNAHDDEHADGSLAAAAGFLVVSDRLAHAREALNGARPSWAIPLYNRHTQRERFVIAAALLIAEVERLDRSALSRSALERGGGG